MNRTRVTSLTFAAACMTAIAIAPIAHAQTMAPGTPMPPAAMSNGPETPPPMPNGPGMNGPGMNQPGMSGPGMSGPAMSSVPPQLVTNGPQSDPGDHEGMRAAQQNVRESGQYDALLRSNPAFRATRIQKECGSIDDPSLHASCVASFGQGETASAAAAHHHYRHHHNGQDD